MEEKPVAEAAPVVERARLSLVVSPETKKAVEVLAKLGQVEYGEVLETRSLKQVRQDYEEIVRLVNS